MESDQRKEQPQRQFRPGGGLVTIGSSPLIVMVPPVSSGATPSASSSSVGSLVANSRALMFLLGRFSRFVMALSLLSLCKIEVVLLYLRVVFIVPVGLLLGLVEEI